MMFAELETQDFLFAVAVLAAGGLLAFFAFRVLKFDNDLALAGLIVVPLIFLLLVSGQLKDFGAFGVSAKFKEEANQTVGKLALKNNLAITDEQASRGDYVREALWQECRPYLVLRPDTVPAKDAPGYDNRIVHIATAVRTSILCGTLQALIVLDERNKVVGFFEPELFLETLRVPLIVYGASPSSGLAAEIRQSELGVVLGAPIQRALSPEAHRVFVPEGADLVEALEKLKASGADLAVVTNSAGEFRGIMPRQLVVEELLLATARALDPDAFKSEKP